MARIYYNEKKLSGQSFVSATINIDSFRYIFENTDVPKNFAKRVSIKEIVKSSFWGLLKLKKETFKKALLYTDNFAYKTKEHTTFIPNSIILYDNEDYNFPSEFYFIVRIENQIELRKCNGGANVKWYDIPKLHKPITDSKVITKIENTFEELTKLSKTFKVEKQQKEKREKERVIAENNRQLINNTQKEAYQILTELCVFNIKSKKNIIKFIEILKNYDNDNYYTTTLNYFMDFLDSKNHNFIMRFDWKEGIEELECSLNDNLKNNYNLTIDFPNTKDYEEDATISENNVFKYFDKPLREHGFQLGFINTQFDEYIILLHKVQDRNSIKSSIKIIGYEYYEK